VTQSVRTSRRRGWLSSMALVMALAVVVAACGGGDDDSAAPDETGVSQPEAPPAKAGGKITYALEAETSAGWCLAEAQLAISGIQVARAIYDTLTAPDENGEIQPFLAESVEPNDDATVWTIKLRDGIKFHDGSDLTAQVVKNNIDAFRGQYPARESLLFTFVLSDITTVEATDAKTVVITTKRPWVALPWFLWSSARFGIMGQKQLDSESCNRDLIGTGPFKMKSWRVNDSFVAEKNPNYWRKDAEGTQLPYLDEITFKPLEDGRARLNGLRAGDFDTIHTSTSLQIDEIRQLADSGDVNNVESDAYAEVGYTMLNSSKPPFDSLTARKAVAFASDREAVNEIRAKGIPQIASGPFAPGSVGYLEDTGWPEFNLDEAKKLVAQYEQEEGQPLRFTLTHSADPDTAATAQLAQQQMKAAGITVNLQSVADQSQLINVAIGGEFQAVLWRNHPGADPDTQYVWWHSGGDAGNPVNFGRIKDPEIDKLFDDARSELDQDKRKTMYEEMNRRFADQLWNLWQSWTIWSVASQPNVFGVLGADLPGGQGPFPGLATGHPVDGLYLGG
jgi:peptide/nickel transport system substrate-binding protein